MLKERKGMKRSTLLTTSQVRQYELEFEGIQQEWNRNGRMRNMLLTSWLDEETMFHDKLITGGQRICQLEWLMEASIKSASQRRITIGMCKKCMHIHTTWLGKSSSQIHTQWLAKERCMPIAKVHLAQRDLSSRIIWGPIPSTMSHPQYDWEAAMSIL